MMIVRPAEESDEQYLNLDKEKEREFHQKLKANLPTLFVAESGNKRLAVNILSRRTSLVCEVEYWAGDQEPELMQEALKGCVYQSILEGRKRVEAVVIGEINHYSPLFRSEGTHPYYDGQGKWGYYYGYVWDLDGVPRPTQGVTYHVQETDKVREYRDKNVGLYQSGLDKQHAVEGRTFSDEINEAIDEVRGFEAVSVLTTTD